MANASKTRARIVSFKIADLVDRDVYQTIMGVPNQRIPKVAGVQSVPYVGRERIDIELEAEADVKKTIVLIEKKLEGLRVHQMNSRLFASTGKSVSISNGYVRVDLSDELRVVLGQNGVESLIGILKTQDIDESSLRSDHYSLIVKPCKPGVTQYCRLQEAVRYYLDYILVMKLRNPDAKRLIES